MAEILKILIDANVDASQAEQIASLFKSIHTLSICFLVINFVFLGYITVDVFESIKTRRQINEIKAKLKSGCDIS